MKSTRSVAGGGSDIRHLWYFVAVAEERSYTRAAERLHVVQQSVSASVKQLEAGLGVQLLDRTSRRVAMTPAGEALYDHAVEILGAVERAWEAARAAGGLSTRRVKVAYNGTIGNRYLVALRLMTREQMPDVEMSWRPCFNDELIPRLAAGEFDVGLAMFPDQIEGLRYERICDLPMNLVTRRDDPLAKNFEVRLSELGGYFLLAMPRDHSPRYHDEFERIFREARTSVNFVDSGDPESGIVPPEIAGNVAGIANRAAANEWAERHRLSVSIPFTPDTPGIPLEVVCHSARASASIDAFVQVCRTFGRFRDIQP